MTAGRGRQPFFSVYAWLGLLAWLGLTFMVAAIGSVASVQAGSFYERLVLPAWAPPGWLFGPVWILLYLLMGIAAWLVWRDNGFRKARWGLTLYILQLVANGLWTWLFFVWRQGALAFLEILLLWVLIVLTIWAFWKLKPLAGLLLFPYLAWVSFAAGLAFTVWQLNPGCL